MKQQPIQCPEGCHACCADTITLDLTTVEALVIYLLNRDIVELIEAYRDLHDVTGYCPFMIMDKCIINAYKPTACQMYMPFEYEERPMCFYLSHGRDVIQQDSIPTNPMNSSSYDIHGCMMMIQKEIDQFMSQSFFKNIYDGTMWWKANYDSLPVNTRICLESVLCEDSIGLQISDHFPFEKILLAGYKTYTDLLALHTALP